MHLSEKRNLIAGGGFQLPVQISRLSEKGYVEEKRPSNVLENIEGTAAGTG